MKTPFKISNLPYIDSPEAYEHLLELMIPAYIGSDWFESLEPIERQHQAQFLFDMWELFHNSSTDIIARFPDVMANHGDIVQNREVLSRCYTHHVMDENYSTAVGFEDMGSECMGAMSLIDLFRN